MSTIVAASRRAGTGRCCRSAGIRPVVSMPSCAAVQAGSDSAAMLTFVTTADELVQANAPDHLLEKIRRRGPRLEQPRSDPSSTRRSGSPKASDATATVTPGTSTARSLASETPSLPSATRP